MFFYSCKTIKTPVPEKSNSFVSPPKKKVSIINVPIRVELLPVFEKVNKIIPKKFIGSKKTCEGISYSYIFNRNPIKYKGENKNLFLSLSGAYSLNLSYCPKCTFLFKEKGNCITPRIHSSCGVNEPQRKLAVNYSTIIGLNKNCSLYSKTKLIDIHLMDACKITAFKYDATASVKKEFKKSFIDFEKEIDNKIKEINIKKELKLAWENLSKPIKVGDFGFLYVRPEKFSLSPIIYKDNSALFNFSLASNPIILSDSSKIIKPIPLPELSEYKNNNGFNVSLDVKANYYSISSFLDKNLKDSVIKINKHRLKFKKFVVSGALENKIAIKIIFSGNKKGSFYLIGTPSFNKTTQIVSFNDLTFDIKTKNLLLKSASWLLNNKICEKIKQYATVDLKPQIDKAKEEIEFAINKKQESFFQLSGKLTTLNVENIIALEKELFVRISSIGVLSVLF